jgi:replicative DNA helicase
VYDRDNPDLEGVAEIHIAKQRNGPTGKVTLHFEKSATRFDNIEEFGDGPPPGPADISV